MIKIGFDAKRAYHNRSGLGNYGRDHLRLVQSHLPDVEIHLYDPLPQKRKFDLQDITARHHYPEGGYRIFPAAWRTLYLGKDMKKHGIQLYHGLSNEIPADMKESGIPSVVTIHDLIFERFPHWYNKTDRYIYRKKFRYASQEADMVVAISQQTKKDLQEFYDIPEEKIRVIYQSCHRAFQVEPTAEFAEVTTKKWKLPQDFVLFVGTMESRKNVIQLAKAMERFDLPLVLVGGQKKGYMDDLLSVIEEQHMTDRVHFYQNIPTEDLAVFFRRAALFVYPSLFEGFGIPLIEALYSGTPVVTSTGSCFLEAGGPDSIYVDPADRDSLEHAMASVLEDSERANKMRRAGLDYAQRFNWDKVATEWVNAYGDLLRSSSGN